MKFKSLRIMQTYHLISLLIILTLFGQGSMLSQESQGTFDKSGISYEEIINRFNLTSVDYIPVGITPLKFKSPEELEKFLTFFKNSTQKTTHIYFSGEYFPERFLVGTESITYNVITRSCSVPLGYGIARFNTWGDIRVGSSGSFRWIDKVLSTYTGLTGLTMVATLTNEYSYAYNQTAAQVSIKGGGIVNVYLIIEGGVRLYSVPVSCSFTYRVY
ncbi:hypothetical protein BECAL_00126 [Bellilinea caldifistulae]|uniref:Uncharacterized protein n=1 Tax=Bellilinea caldifistulae TaxID=360411 RepID=A0A0P6XTZ6_9CHLR|nr:hypothetical protein [Bellilinea caldifistulae]KPL76783.1 hypothetical protein AC812_05690 [Bellilinea caldifistulae]GAP08993.1 hypothetical protein BECAL_00126 [Bellilinea caldifistulae]